MSNVSQYTQYDNKINKAQHDITTLAYGRFAGHEAIEVKRHVER
ncbi:MAG: hypothetical protein ACLUSV_01325 [Streptococcus sp.]